MEEDDGQMVNELMPNSMEYTPPGVLDLGEEDPEVHQAAATEALEMSSALPVLQGLIDWFDTQIELCDSVHNAVELAKLNRWDVSVAIQAHEIVRVMLVGRRTDLANAFKRFMDGGEE
jgi:hypothetical protein